ncbi:MAG: putative ABC transporter permease [Clostridia bacterium]|nr:putative ABC transporter permease [Clostridia bacterium]
MPLIQRFLHRAARLFPYFLLYSFIGWCIEEIYVYAIAGRFIGRGFLNTPLCPIYGFGALLIILTLSPLKNKPLHFFAGAVTLTTLLELCTGLIMEALLLNKGWDYSKEAINFYGIICLKFSLAWGILSILLIKLLHPCIQNLEPVVPHTVKAAAWGLILLMLVTNVVIALVTGLEAEQLHILTSKLISRLMPALN